MKLINKSKTIKNGVKEIKVYFLNMPIWVEHKSLFQRILKVFGITILSRKNKSCPYQEEKIFNEIAKFKEFIKYETKRRRKHIRLWIDHALGGGTETYTFNQFNELKNKCIMLRLQYNPYYDCYIFSIPDAAVFYTPTFKCVQKIVSDFNFEEICINNIVGWHVVNVLNLVSFYKKNHIKTKISFRGHDFQSLCPSFNLLNCEGCFCNLCYKKGCEIVCKRLN